MIVPNSSLQYWHAFAVDKEPYSLVYNRNEDSFKGGNPEYHVLAIGFFRYVGINTKSLKHGIIPVKSSKRGYSEVFPFI